MNLGSGTRAPLKRGLLLGRTAVYFTTTIFLVVWQPSASILQK